MIDKEAKDALKNMSPDQAKEELQLIEGGVNFNELFSTDKLKLHKAK